MPFNLRSPPLRARVDFSDSPLTNSQMRSRLRPSTTSRSLACTPNRYLNGRASHPGSQGCALFMPLPWLNAVSPVQRVSSKGLEQMLAQSIPVSWEDPSPDVVKQTIMKKYCSLIHGQPVLEAVLDLKRRNTLTADEIETQPTLLFHE